ncbi:transglutaminase domain-containing protein [Planctomonas sp. JC2975]|uniref:transglutaminase domain-containing protein n=1 Tax=Planctomonas sp. JC2975 TaxID=2729626 RepID=UPI001474330E|nr:transglutaminase domain-containing protein [Planctomonas sp. JC2975]NNC13220.1 transglutaminase domain-containing protein [Planctomonas sp. JC2975]
MNRRDTFFRVVGTAYMIVLSAACVAAFWPVYRDLDFLVMGVGAVLAGAAVAVIGAWRHWSSLVTVLVSAAVFLVIGVPLAVPEETLWRAVPTLQGFLDFVTAIAVGWKELVTIGVPVGSYQALLTPAYTLAFVATVVAVTTALRSRRPDLALVAPLAVFGLAIVLGSDTSATPIALTLFIVVLSVGWLVWMRRRRRLSRLVSLASEHADGVRRSERSVAAARSTAIAVTALIVALAVGAGMAVGLPSSAARTVARSATTPPFDPRDYPSPLSGFRSYLQPGLSDEALFTLHGVSDLKRVQIATLDTYDGVVYAVGTRPGDSGAFARIPDTVSRPMVTAHNAAPAQTVDVTIEGLQGPWLPTFGNLERISFGGTDPSALGDGFYYNPETASMADVSGLQAGDTYSLTASPLPSMTIAQLATARPGKAQLPALDVLPDHLVDTVHRYEGDATTPGGRLALTLKRLAETGYISHGLDGQVKSLSGHGADRIDSLLTEVPMVGDQEQYAVTAALMARQLGFPARVVLGFQVPQSGDNVTVKGSDVTAWIQVQTAKDGWVDVDPNPQVRPIPEKQPDEPKQISRPQSIVDPPKDTTDRDQNPPPQAHVAQQHVKHLPAWLSTLLTVLAVLGWTLLIVALVASPFLAVIAAKWRRRRARRSPRVLPRGRIAGAWLEFADTALDHGYTPPGSPTRSEVAEQVGGPRPVLLAAVADRSAFGLAEPTEGDADQVWRAVDELRRDLDGRTTRWGRIRARVSLRSLGGYRGTAGTDPRPGGKAR